MFRLRSLEIALITLLVIISTTSVAVSAQADGYQTNGTINSLGSSFTFNTFQNSTNDTSPVNQTSSYNITFIESGLSSNERWSVTLDNNTIYSNSTAIVFERPNGAYSYVINQVQGYQSNLSSGNVTLNGSDQNITVRFSLLNYTVTFDTTNLPINSEWWVNLTDRSSYSSSSESMSFQKNFGNYSFGIEISNKSWKPSPSSGVFAANQAVVINVTFEKVLYNLTFTENNLTKNILWYVSVDGLNISSSTSSISFDVQNGSHYFTVFSKGYTSNESSGTIIVNGKNVWYNVSFAVATYLVSFKETGLPTTSSWQLTFNGKSYSSSGTFKNFTMPSGNYSYSVSNLSYYVSNPSSGILNVLSDTSINVSFSRLYVVTFTESGLGPGITWWVTLGKETNSSANNQTSFKVLSGTYNYAIFGTPGYTSSPSSGQIPVNDGNISVPVVFSKVKYTVTFSESGLPSGKTWSVSFSNLSVPSNESTIVFSVPNGTYNYTISQVYGYAASTYSGSINIAGSNSVLNVTWSQVTYALRFNESGLASGTSWSVTLNGSVFNTSNSTTLVFYLPEGNYSYAANTGSGYLVSNGTGTIDLQSNTSRNIQFSELFSVSFYEGGLNSSDNWTVTFNGVTSISSGPWINFTEVKGNFNYTIGDVAGYTVTPTNGTLSVGTGDASQNVTFAPIKYNVVFQETSLPNGTKWFVTFNKKTLFSTSDLITFTVPGGTYPFSVTPIANYSISPSSGKLPVNGNTFQVITFKLVKYNVTFTESGLQSGTLWNATLNGVTRSSTANEIIFQISNGTYPFSIGNIKYFHLTNETGSVRVDGSAINVPVQFKSINNYSLVFAENTLPIGKQWSVTVNGTVYSSSLNSSNGITVSLPNGTYSYKVDLVSGYVPQPSSGSVSINGSDVYLIINFTRVYYNVVFEETGLSSGKEWTVVFEGTSYGPATGSRIISVPNGTYHFTIDQVFGYTSDPTNGNVTVNGSDVTLSIAFTAIPYAVNFTEIGLPAGTYWYISINGQTNHSLNSIIHFSLPDGNYNFKVGLVPGYRPNVSQGSFVVNGGSVNIYLNFTITLYTVTYHETGLPNGTTWEIIFGTQKMNSTTENITFEVPNGTYRYNISVVPGYYPIYYHSQIIINGSSPVAIDISWSRSSYSIDFIQGGLPTGTSWSVTLNSTTIQTTAENQMAFYLPNGTYHYSISKIPGYSTNSYNGSFTVNGGIMTINIIYHQVKYEVRFTETGLSSNTIWSVVLNGTTLTSITTDLSFELPNGTYNFTISEESGYADVISPVQIVVNGNNTTFEIDYLKLFVITFVENGLPGNTKWSVTMNGVTKTSTSTLITFYETNGTYPYTVVADISGSDYTSPSISLPVFVSQNGITNSFTPYNTVVVYGQVSVSGHAMQKTVQFVQTDTSNSPPPYALIAAVIAALAGVASVLIYFIRRNQLRK